MAGCASSGASTVPVSTTQVQQVVVQNDNGATQNVVTMNRIDNAYSADLNATPAELWPALLGELTQLKIPVTSVNEQRHVVASTESKLRRIGGQQVSYYFDCPGLAYGNAADGGDVYVTLQAQLLPKAPGSELRMLVSAIAVSTTGNRGQCTSNGKLENQMLDTLKTAAKLQR